ncbi:hypothetical protein J2Y48_004248 [Mycoplana sp. BE70]|nr:hypothetical protein [Mycoplana sp. BE70]
MPYIEKYAIFDNLDETLLLNIEDLNRYSDSAQTVALSWGSPDLPRNGPTSS